MSADTMQGLAKGLDAILNPDGGRTYGFTLLVYEFAGEAGQRVNYVSNAKREDMIAAMKEWLARNEGRHHEGGRA